MAKIPSFLSPCKYLRPKQMPFAHHSKLTPVDILTNLNERLPRFAKSDFFYFLSKGIKQKVCTQTVKKILFNALLIPPSEFNAQQWDG
jgi:hypothetical protein